MPYWLGGAIVSIVVMSYVFLGGMRGTAWVNTLQTTLFLLFGAIAVTVVGAGMGGFGEAMETLLASPATSPLLTRERVSPLYFFSYTFIPLSSIAFPHIGIFCLTARQSHATSRRRSSSIRSACCHLAAVGVSRRRGQRGSRCRPFEAKLEARARSPSRRRARRRTSARSCGRRPRATT